MIRTLVLCKTFKNDTAFVILIYGKSMAANWIDVSNQE